MLLVASMVDVYCLLFVVEYLLLNGVVCCVLCVFFFGVRCLLSVVCCAFRVDVGIVACCCLLFGVCCVLFVVRYRLIVWFVCVLCAAR